MRDYTRVAWYRVRFSLPYALVNPPVPNPTYVLHFGAVDYFSAAWLNGKYVDTSEGGYLPYEIHALLSDGEHTALDDMRATFGMRSMSTSADGHLMLNGRPLYLRGALDQDYYPEMIYTPFSDAELDRQFAQARHTCETWVGGSCNYPSKKPPMDFIGGFGSHIRWRRFAHFHHVLETTQIFGDRF